MAVTANDRCRAEGTVFSRRRGQRFARWRPRGDRMGGGAGKRRLLVICGMMWSSRQERRTEPIHAGLTWDWPATASRREPGLDRDGDIDARGNALNKRHHRQWPAKTCCGMPEMDLRRHGLGADTLGRRRGKERLPSTARCDRPVARAWLGDTSQQTSRVGRKRIDLRDLSPISESTKARSCSRRQLALRPTQRQPRLGQFDSDGEDGRGRR